VSIVQSGATAVAARRTAWKWAKRAALVLAAAVGARALQIAVGSYRVEASVFVPRPHPVELPAEARSLQSLQNVSFADERGHRLQGWYVPGRNRAGVVLTHGSGGDRLAVTPEALLLAARGFSVLWFDWPGHGESAGPIAWGAGERGALSRALQFVLARGDVDAPRLGVFGFSMGGYITSQLARDPRIRAAALAGTPPDPLEQTRWEYRKYGVISQLPAMWAISRAGFSLTENIPRDQVAHFAPRPLLIVTGSEDSLVPAIMARALFEAARAPKQLLVVPGAGHGDYMRAAPDAYAQPLLAFFERHLLN
jgi:pimeloyl-ACP methyl ester carboxylesterase